MAHFHIPKPLHGWREFIGEVGIIVIGVLIALGAEQIVEVIHLHEKERAAEQAMRLELATDDGPQAYGRVAVANCLKQRIDRVLRAAQDSPTDELRQAIDDYAPPSRGWDSEAWKAVLASDVGSHIGAERLIDWSASYRLIPSLNEANQDEAKLVTELRELLPSSAEPAQSELQSVKRNAALLMQLNGKMAIGSKLLLARMKKVGAEVPEATGRELLANARAIYGSCVQVPDPNAANKQTVIGDLRNNVWDSLRSSPSGS